MTWDDDDYYDVSFAVHKSRRYNAKLRDHYQSFHDRIKAANAFAASGAFFAIIGSYQKLGATLAAVVALASFLDMIFEFEKKARLHTELTIEFSGLAAKLEKWEPNLKNLSNAKAQRITIESREPHEKRLVDWMADNEEARARGCTEDQLMPLSRWQKYFGYYFDFGEHRIAEWKAENERQCINELEETTKTSKET